jgi:hypothetical protein
LIALFTVLPPAFRTQGFSVTKLASTGLDEMGPT